MQEYLAITYQHVLGVCECAGVPTVGEKRRWRKLALNTGNSLQILLYACVGHEIVYDHQMCMRRSCVTKVTQDLKTLFVWPIMENLTNNEDRGVFDWLRSEEVVCCVWIINLCYTILFISVAYLGELPGKIAVHLVADHPRTVEKEASQSTANIYQVSWDWYLQKLHL